MGGAHQRVCSVDARVERGEVEPRAPQARVAGDGLDEALGGARRLLLLAQHERVDVVPEAVEPARLRLGANLSEDLGELLVRDARADGDGGDRAGDGGRAVLDELLLLPLLARQVQRVPARVAPRSARWVLRAAACAARGGEGRRKRREPARTSGGIWRTSRVRRGARAPPA